MKKALNFLRPLLALFAVALFSFSGCNCADEVPDGVGTPCESDEECEDDQECVDGYCEYDSDGPDAGMPDADVDDETDTDPTPDAGPDADEDTDTGEEPDPCPDPNTCAGEGVDCGWITDGCGGAVDCGGCPDGQVCGTGDDAGTCIDDTCEPSIDCDSAGVSCGLISDGCGGFVDCGICGDGDYCATDGSDAGQCLGIPCDALECSDLAPGECGLHPDGCGGFVDCGGCEDGETCDVHNAEGQCVDIDCDPIEPADCAAEFDPGECGPHPDGCGGFVECGSCPDGEMCGTGADHGECVDDGCVPTTDCSAAGVECGLMSDGCGGIVDCGGCPGADEYCAVDGSGNNQCVGIDCDPIACADLAPGECGVHADGCGGFIDCGGCADDEVCEIDTAEGECIDVDCDPIDPADCTAEFNPGECGPHPDGCGGFIDCGTCDSGEICGTGSDLGECIEPDCVPLTCDDYDDVNCGVMSDGCGGLTDSCGDCEDPEICGGGGQPNVCGAEAGGGDDCENLCEDQAVCSSGEATTVTGTVYAPNADLPIPNAMVYVPNDPLDELPDVEAATDCMQCEDLDLGNPLVGTTTDYDGTFELRHVPAETEFPLVIRIGQWRRVVMIDPVDACEDEQLSAQQTRLPTSHQEPDGGVTGQYNHIPKIAVTTGRVDAMECVFYKLGVEQSEFTRNYEDGRIHIYRSNGAVADSALSNACSNVGCAHHDCTDRYPGTCGSSNDGLMVRDNLAHHLYTDPQALDDYDMVVMGCEGYDHTSYRDGAELQNIHDYVNAGGRLFASHFAYDWLHNTNDLEDTAYWGQYDSFYNSGLAFVDDTHSPGETFWDWLQLVDADYPDSGPNGEPQIEIQDPRPYIYDVNYNLSTRWVYTDENAPGHNNQSAIQQYSFNTPVYDDPEDQCGQVSYSAFHVADYTSAPVWGPGFPSHCPTGDLSPQEKVLSYMLFDLAACVTEDDEPPEPECEPLTCDDYDDVECGLVSDGCGDHIDCGDCPEGSACGAGGAPNVCSAECTPMTCDDHGAECGTVDDGCGGTIDCGDCPSGQTCGGGGEPYICGCEPVDCDDHGAECGEVDDGCGGTVDCGDCPSGMACGAGGDANVCAVDCEPLTCDDHGAECGIVDDGCSATLDCGTCPGEQTCGAGGEPNQCACEPLTCDDHGAECGTVDDGCGGTLDCGDCPAGEECGAGGEPNICACESLDCDDHGAECGTVDDGCGGELDCGPCPDGEECGAGGEPNICACEDLSCEDHGAECGAVDDGCGGTLDCGPCPGPETCGAGGEANQCDCVPLTCEDHNAECGEVSDGCGATLDCGECPGGWLCEDFQCVEPECRPLGAPCEYDIQCCSDTCGQDSDGNNACITG